MTYRFKFIRKLYLYMQIFIHISAVFEGVMKNGI